MKKAAIAAAALGGAYLGVTGLTFYEIMARSAGLPGKIDKAMKKKAADGEQETPDPRVEWMHAQTFTRYTRISPRGQTLCAWYLPAEKPTDRFVLCSHGYRCDGRGEFRFMIRYLHECGLNVFLVDHQAAGDSTGRYIGFGGYEAEDLADWIDFMCDTFGREIQILLCGKSMGSATVMLLCGTELPQNVKGAVADCGYTSVRDEFAYHLHKMHVLRFPVIETVDLWTKCFAGYRFVDVRPIDAVRRAKLPMLFIHGEADDFVPTEMVYDLYEACGSEKYLLTVPGAGHSESYQKNSALYEDAFGAFLERCFAKETVS